MPQLSSPRGKPDRRRPLPTWRPWRPRTVALPVSVGISSANFRTLSYSGVRPRKRKGTSRRRWRRRSGYRRRGREKIKPPMTTYINPQRSVAPGRGGRKTSGDTPLPGRRGSGSCNGGNKRQTGATGSSARPGGACCRRGWQAYLVKKELEALPAPR